STIATVCRLAAKPIGQIDGRASAVAVVIDQLDVVAVGIEQERAVVLLAILGTQVFGQVLPFARGYPGRPRQSSGPAGAGWDVAYERSSVASCAVCSCSWPCSCSWTRCSTR